MIITFSNIKKWGNVMKCTRYAFCRTCNAKNSCYTFTGTVKVIHLITFNAKNSLQMIFNDVFQT